jgi:hypothetical protein
LSWVEFRDSVGRQIEDRLLMSRHKHSRWMSLEEKGSVKVLRNERSWLSTSFEFEKYPRARPFWKYFLIAVYARASPVWTYNVFRVRKGNSDLDILLKSSMQGQFRLTYFEFIWFEFCCIEYSWVAEQRLLLIWISF